jgi:hypothetical protein
MVGNLKSGTEIVNSGHAPLRPSPHWFDRTAPSKGDWGLPTQSFSLKWLAATHNCDVICEAPWLGLPPFQLVSNEVLPPFIRELRSPRWVDFRFSDILVWAPPMVFSTSPNHCFPISLGELDASHIDSKMAVYSLVDHVAQRTHPSDSTIKFTSWVESCQAMTCQWR